MKFQVMNEVAGRQASAEAEVNLHCLRHRSTLLRPFRAVLYGYHHYQQVKVQLILHDSCSLYVLNNSTLWGTLVCPTCPRYGCPRRAEANCKTSGLVLFKAIDGDSSLIDLAIQLFAQLTI